jgi:hypothetical protein
MVQAIEMITSSQFRYSAALVPWSQSELQKLYTCWIRLHKAASSWRLPNSKSFSNAQFYLPTTQGGRTITQPLVLQLQAIDIHIRSLSLWNDDIRMAATVKIGEMFNKSKAAFCEECALALAHKHRSQNSDVFSRFFALCDLLKVQAELPKISLPTFQNGHLGHPCRWRGQRLPRKPNYQRKQCKAGTQTSV